MELPSYFQYLNKDTLVWVNCADLHFGVGFGKVIDNICYINVNKTGLYNVLIFGDRCDSVAEAVFNKYGVEYDPELLEKWLWFKQMMYIQYNKV